MEIWRTVLALLRRPAVLVPMLLLALVLGGAAYAVVPLHYTAKEIMVLTTPSSGGAARRATVNPLLNFDQSLQTSASLLVQAMNTPDVAELLGAGKGTKNSFKVSDAGGSAELFGAEGPFLEVTVDSGESADAAYQTTQAVGNFMRSQLAERQKALQAPKWKYIVVASVVSPTNPELNIMPKLKAVTLGLLAGLFCGLGCAYVVSRLWERSRNPVGAVVDGPPDRRITNGYGGPVPTVAVDLAGPGSGR